MKIAIIGGGVSGILTALHLYTKAPSNISINIFEASRDQIAKGPAYSTSSLHHLLNVRAHSMSLFFDKPSHFVEWLSGNGYSYTPDDFVPRQVFGRYVYDVFQKIRAEAGDKIKIEERKISSLSDLDGYDTVVLAFGNFAPASIPPIRAVQSTLNNYYENPWKLDTSKLLSSESVAVIGTGLTGVDSIVDLLQNGYTGHIYGVSRFGTFSHVHADTHGQAVPPPPKLTGSLSKKMRAFREWASNGPYAWQAAIDAFRPFVQKTWVSLPYAEQQRFIRHVRPFWDIHRHRMAPEILSLLNDAISRGQLSLHKGIITAATQGEKGISLSLTSKGAVCETVTARAVVNCTGPSTFHSLDDVLVRSLIANGEALIDGHGLGLVCDIEGRLIDAEGNVNPRVWAVGPLRKGMLWESIALREIREQAPRLAEMVLSEDGHLRHIESTQSDGSML